MQEINRAGGKLRVSVVIPVFNGSQTIQGLTGELHAALSESFELEVVLVNDCSADDSAVVCAELARTHPWVRFVDLARNFGEHNAVMAGLAHCSGDCAAIVDDDFQNPPSEVRKLVEKLQEGYDVVFSRYHDKQHHPLRNLASRFNNAVATALLPKDRRLYLASFKVINRFLIDEITRYEGPFPYIDGLILRATSNYATQLVVHDPRQSGRSNYTLRKLLRLWLAMFTNFSILPLRAASLAGFFFAAVGLVLAVVFFIEKLNNPDLPTGWASLVVIFLTVSGVQLFALGMLGEYLGRLFLKDNGSPMFVVRRTINCEPREDEGR
ncbi:MAG: glycosyltransferase family 2 protein [Proteobacteria bacterium]|nr:glycosyltransferase family 2 protein [Pseudomonadota bacterium]